MRKLVREFVQMVLVGCVVVGGAPSSWAQSPPLGAEAQRLSLMAGGRERVYWLYVPPTLVPGRPLVIVLHGSMSSGEGARRGDTEFGFDRLADQHGFVVAYPNAVVSFWNDCRKELVVPARQQNFDDVGFLRALIAKTLADHKGDPSRVYAFGFSGGGHMALRLAWEAPEEIAAVAIAGASLTVKEALDCPVRGSPRRLMIMNGTADDINGYGGGKHSNGTTTLSSPDSAAEFARQLGLGAAQNESRLEGVGANIHVTTWQRGDRPIVSHYKVEGMGHMVPLAWREKFDGPAAAWKFFTAP
jgi:polyhydroxybutyrate depolymerase